MESANTLCPGTECKGGVLAHLERLEAQMNKSNRKSEEPTVREKESSLRTKIRELQQQRDRLRVEVKQWRARVSRKARLALPGRGDQPQSGNLRVKESSAKEDSSKTMLSEQEVLEKQWRNLKAILQAYRFTGLSGKLTNRRVCVYISTAFEGNLLDSYFVDLAIEKPLRIHHHSIPAFIPLEKIATAYLQTDVQRFLFSLSEYLNAYVGRKYQADQLESDFCAFLTGPLQRSALCNLLSFTYKVEQGTQAFSFSARLLYEDLTAALPTGVTVTRPAGMRNEASLKSLHVLSGSSNWSGVCGIRSSRPLGALCSHTRNLPISTVSTGFPLCRC
ncbi:centromere protein O isoform X1 [Rattus rattus]|uniref:centromere protein O isoform X1 n=1 Tax=Rattus rattus TaxID=10117 RepID=UPI0013F2D398|nr:centromere protein O isoform X1 [Rattus rattus]XP_032764972.1 centromere protein O isoform X1 [Rattus rattus]